MLEFVIVVGVHLYSGVSIEEIEEEEEEEEEEVSQRRRRRKR